LSVNCLSENGFVKSRLNPLEQNALYKKRHNRYLKQKWGLKKTTLILGAKCADGVVLVGDRKVTHNISVRDTYTEKIKQCQGMQWAVFGAAGATALFEEFIALLPSKVAETNTWVIYNNQRLTQQHERTFQNNSLATPPPTHQYSTEHFKQDCVRLLTEMRTRYTVAFQENHDCLEILIGTIEDNKAKLYYLESENCVPIVVPDIFFIGERSVVEWLRKSWNAGMNMRQTAKLGILAIEYAEKENLCEGVGVGDYLPQVWLVPNGQGLFPREVLGAELELLVADAHKKFRKLKKNIHSLFRS